jgi:hypothetical protein
MLALAGTSAVAGCQSLDGLAGDTESTISVYDLPDIDEASARRQIVPPSVPVTIEPAYVADTRDRVTALLSELPTPFGPAAIPNGYVRQRLTDAADDATDGLDDARTAQTDLQALQSLQNAREQARYAAAGWAMADQGLSAAPLRREHRQAVADAESFRDAHEYVGTDLVRATLVHARIEDALRRLTDDTQPHVHEDGALLTVAGWGETAESAQATLADARHLDTQFTASLPDDAGTVEDALAGAAETLAADLRARQSDQPPQPTAEDWGVAEHVVAELRREARETPEDGAATSRPASAVVDATERIAHARALSTVQERIDAGEITRVESAEALRAIRTTAYETLGTALDESPAPELARTVVSDVSWRVSSGDRELGRIDRDVPAGRLDDIVEDYVVVAAVARATPAACRQTVDALETA